MVDTPFLEPTGGRIKRAADVAFALGLLTLLGPLMVAIALWIRRDSPGPALFRQQRIGFAGRPFTILKFRTMVVGAEGMGSGLAVMEGDPRITRAGAILRKLSLDELPQLINVLRGDMSVVGPRPTVAWQVAHYDARQRGRLAARPGVTGLAQLVGRNSIPWSQRIELDLEYIERWSLPRDVWILIRTLLVPLHRRDTYRAEHTGFDLAPPEPAAPVANGSPAGMGASANGSAAIPRPPTAGEE